VGKAVPNRSRASLAWGGGADAYLTAIHVLLQEEPPERVVAARVAEYLGVSPVSVSRALSRLQAAGDLGQRVPALVLTAQGWDHAERLLRNHHITECWLIDDLGMDWTEVHQEAQRIGNAMSDQVAEILWERLGRPTRCPHGTPIPGSEASESIAEPLARVTGGHYVIDRVLEQVEGFVELLRELKNSGLLPEAKVEVMASPAGGPRRLRVLKGPVGPWVSLQPWLAARVLLRPLEEETRLARIPRVSVVAGGSMKEPQ